MRASLFKCGKQCAIYCHTTVAVSLDISVFFSYDHIFFTGFSCLTLPSTIELTSWKKFAINVLEILQYEYSDTLREMLSCQY